MLSFNQRYVALVNMKSKRGQGRCVCTHSANCFPRQMSETEVARVNGRRALHRTSSRDATLLLERGFCVWQFTPKRNAKRDCIASRRVASHRIASRRVASRRVVLQVWVNCSKLERRHAGRTPGKDECKRISEKGKKHTRKGEARLERRSHADTAET